jgi:beta-fructofuranosidase
VTLRTQTWHMFYTGISTREAGAVQRIGLATSDDLIRWEKQGVLLEADHRRYQKLGPDTREEAWRDPWVWWDDDSRRFHMPVTAKADRGPSDGRGVIGHAWSADLRSWWAGPQLVHLGGAWRILFSAGPRDHSAARLARPGVVAEGGTHYLTSRQTFGRYTLDRDAFLVGDPQSRYYAGRLIQRDGGWFFIAWRHNGGDGRFLGELSDPMPLTVHADGSLSVQLIPMG